jgi:hypothetical protein
MTCNQCFGLKYKQGGVKMPFVSRDNSGQISAIFRDPNSDATEELIATNPAILSFLFDDQTESRSNSQDPNYLELQNMQLSDLGLVRVIEDLIHALMDKGIIAITDLPDAAVTRLRAREKTRRRLEKITKILSSENDTLL